MPIKVKGYLTYKEVVGERLITIDQGQSLTVIGLLRLLSEDSNQEFRESIFDPRKNRLGEYVAVIINGRSYTNLPKELNTQLKDGDEVAIFPPMAGG